MKKDWITLLRQARAHYHKGDTKLQEAVKSLMMDQGFNNDVINLFQCNFASGAETIISFNQDGEMADLDLCEASTMTREEIIAHLGRYMSKKNIAILKGDSSGNRQDHT